MSSTIVKSDTEWKAELDDMAFCVLREHATERPGTSPLLHEHRNGTFVCKACATPLYPSTTKFESGSGWPSFWDPLPNAVETTVVFVRQLRRFVNPSFFPWLPFTTTWTPPVAYWCGCTKAA